jgi:hypothetical protein
VQSAALERTCGTCLGVPLLTLLRRVCRTYVCRPVATNVKGGTLGKRFGERARCDFASSSRVGGPASHS